MDIKLTTDQVEFVRHEAEAEGYESVEAYVTAHIERARRYHARQATDASLERALSSGEATPMTAEDWQGIRERGQKRLQA